ncbi:hypothetical protein [Staphylococcus simulans]|uniref:hypothetical protein n=1 Tax=Staphylococcus simulans TaxID=1286 RepID=UPI00374DA079
MNEIAISLGHLFGLTIAILKAHLLSKMKKRSKTKYVMISMCIRAGMMLHVNLNMWDRRLESKLTAFVVLFFF